MRAQPERSPRSRELRLATRHRARAAATGADVKIVMARCPYRGQAVSTGIEIEEATFSRLPESLILSRCPLCGLEHVWWKAEAWLEEARYDSAPGAPSD